MESGIVKRLWGGWLNFAEITLHYMESGIVKTLWGGWLNFAEITLQRVAR